MFRLYHNCCPSQLNKSTTFLITLSALQLDISKTLVI